MGLFGDVGKIFTRGVVAVATGGLSEVARAVAPETRGALDVAGQILAPTTIEGITRIGVAAATRNPSFLIPGVTGGFTSTRTQTTGPITGFVPGGTMGLNIGGILGQVGTIFGGGQNPIFQGVSGVANLASQFFPTPSMTPSFSAPVPQPVKAMVPGTAVAVRGLTREIFDAGGKVLSRLGIGFGATPGSFTSALKRSLSSIASLARRTPAGTMVSILVGLGLTAMEANMLTAWHVQRRKGRRMNAANSRALRRAARRIRSFHKLCTHTDLLKSRSRVGGRGRCGSCRKSPCNC